MSEYSNSGRFRINSVNSTDILPFCNGSSHLSDIVKNNFMENLTESVDNPQPCFSHEGSMHHFEKSTRLMDGIELLATSCPNLTAMSRGNIVPQVSSDDFYSDPIRPVSVHLEVDKLNSDNGKHCDDASSSTRKLPRKEEVIVDTGPNGRFLKFSKEIGRGAFKTVYKGIDTETGVAIAWCEIHNRRCTRDETVRFKREVEILKKLQHPNILRFYDFFYSSNRRGFVLVTELMNAGTLRTYLSRFPSIPLRLIKNWCLQILRGLQFLHSREPSIIHRDLKCDNIFINGANGSVKIGDLGLAVLSNSNARTVIGTPEFMAPEMYEEDYDEAVDIWAFGLCVLEMYTLEYPYKECRSPAAIFKRVSGGIRPKALDIVEDQDLYSIIVSCTEKEKRNRVTIPTLLNHEFFQEQEIHMEEVPPIGTDTVDPNNIKLVLSREQKAITLDFNLEIDNPEKVVDELVTAGFVKHNEYAIFVKSLRNRIDKALRNKQLSCTLNREETANCVIGKDCSTPVDVFHKVDLCHEQDVIDTENIDFREHEFEGENYNDINEIQSRFHTMASCKTHKNLLSPTLSEKHLEELQHSKRNVRLTLTGITGDKLICFLISANTTLEFGFSLQEYSSNELVKNMIDNKFILSSEQHQFKCQAEQLTKLVQAKKLENMDDASIVDYIKELPFCDHNYNVIDQGISCAAINSEGRTIVGIQNNSDVSDDLPSIHITSKITNHFVPNNHIDSTTQSTFSNLISNAPMCMPVVNFRTRSCMSTKGIPSLPIFSTTDPPGFQSKFNNSNPKSTSENSRIRQNQANDHDIFNNERLLVILPEISNSEIDFEKGISNTLDSQSSTHCNSTPQFLSLPVSSSQPILDNSFQKDKLSDKHNVPSHFPTPFNFAKGNLDFNGIQPHFPSYNNSPIIDERMSDVLLLALYKGFQAPEFQEYMCTIEKRILLESQSLQNIPTSSFLLTDNPMQPSQLPSFSKLSSGKNEVIKSTSRRVFAENDSEIFNERVTGNLKQNVGSQMESPDIMEEFTESNTTKLKPTPFLSRNSLHILQTQTNMPSHRNSIEAVEYPLNNSKIGHEEFFDELSVMSPNDINSSRNNATSYNSLNENFSINPSKNGNMTQFDLSNNS